MARNINSRTRNCQSNTGSEGREIYGQPADRQFSFTARSDHMARNINSKTRIYYSNTESEGREIRPHGEKFKLENKEHSFSIACNLSCVVFTTLVFA